MANTSASLPLQIPLADHFLTSMFVSRRPSPGLSCDGVFCGFPLFSTTGGWWVIAQTAVAGGDHVVGAHIDQPMVTLD